MNTSQDITQAFTCPNFRRFVVDNFCNGKLPILKEQVENVEQIKLPTIFYNKIHDAEGNYTETTSSPEICSLDGIEWFTGLTALICNNNPAIQKLDVSKNTKLRVLECNYCKLEKLDLSHTPELEKLICEGNKLTQLDITQNPSLKNLDCSKNEMLESLNLTYNPELKVLVCESLQLKELDISKNNLLEVIDCNFNELTFIDTSHKINLKELYCLSNKLETLDVTNSPKLESLFCGRNCLKELDLSNNPLLYDLDCAKNQLSSIDFTHNPCLKDVFMYNNKGITSIDLSRNPVLFRILIDDCSLTELDLSHNPELKICSCNNNLLTEKPDISNNPYLQQAKRMENNYSFSYDNNLIPQPSHTVRGVGTFEYSYSTYQLKTIVNDIPWLILLNVDNKGGVKRLASTVKAIWDEFPQLIEACITFITEQYPDPDGVSGYKEGALEIESDKTFRIGFGGGDHGAGEEYLYVGFNRKREMIKEVIFEVY